MTFKIIFKLYMAAGLAALFLVAAGCSNEPAEKLIDFKQINLVSSVDGIAPNTDANLRDAWGLEFGDPGRIWVNANTGYSIVYDGNGAVVMVKDEKNPNTLVPLRVLVPDAPAVVPSGPAPLTGMIFNPLHTKPGSPFDGDAFVFVSEHGVIAGWQPLPSGIDPLRATIRVNNNAAGAVYKGVTSFDDPSGWRLYIANFGQGQIEVFDASYKPAKTAGTFSDPAMPIGYAPFNVKIINGQLFVTYAKQSIDKANDVKGGGNGYVDIFDVNGTFIKRLISGGRLNSPWGLALAPDNYGALSKQLLVGNFGDGHINVYDPSSGEYKGTISENGQTVQIDGLWSLTFGTDNGAGAKSQLFFSAGPSAESQGMVGQLLYVGINVAADNVLTVYSGQHQQTIDSLVASFEKETGIKVSVRNDDEGILTNQIVEEGTKSPADLFITENSPALESLSAKGLLSPVAAGTLAEVPAHFNSAEGNWVGLSARVSALVYNTNQINSAKLPTSLLDLAKPEWKGKIAIAPSETDFQPLVTALVKVYGQAQALNWLQGLKANSEIYPDNETVVAAVNNGQSMVGLINHYYWYRLRDEVGMAKIHSDLHYFATADVGNLVDVSGAAVLKSSLHQTAAQKFLAFLVSKEGQVILSQSESYEYPLGSGVESAKKLPAFEKLRPPAVSVKDLGDGSASLALLKQVGFL